jgi:predicted GNAT superfamily acetyltransferase
VRWNMAPGAPAAPPLPPPDRLDAAPIVAPAPGEAPAAEARVTAAFGPGSPLVRVEVPADIAAVQARSLANAASWRLSSRPAFMEGLRRGYRIAGFYRDNASGRCFYVLSRPSDHRMTV